MRPGSLLVLQWLLLLVTADLALVEDAPLEGLMLETVRRAGGKRCVDVRCQSVTCHDNKFHGCFVSGNSSTCQPLTMTAGSGTCVLIVEVSAIHLNLLGLKVDTSPICLTITAPSGDLLCDLVNAIKQGTLIQFLANCSPAQIDMLCTKIKAMCDEACNRMTTFGGQGNAVVSMPPSSQTVCTILHLSLGPVTLNIFGLVVRLDNCRNGAITVDVTAVSGQVLGTLLCKVKLLQITFTDLLDFMVTLCSLISDPSKLVLMLGVVINILGLAVFTIAEFTLLRLRLSLLLLL